MKNHHADKQTIAIDNPWGSLRRYTDARIGLGRTGISQTTQAQLAFQLAHAQARDAVNIPIDFENIQQQLSEAALPSITLHSKATDRQVYLQRPDLGRQLNLASRAMLKKQIQTGLVYDATIVVADGLSSTAVQQHSAEVTALIAEHLTQSGLSYGPVCLAQQARVAVGDEIAEIVGSRLLILLIGERPGLSSPDSLGIYYTYKPKVGLTDASRNCISNIRPQGLQIQAAVSRLMWLIKESERLDYSGVRLKDRTNIENDLLEKQRNFLLE